MIEVKYSISMYKHTSIDKACNFESLNKLLFLSFLVIFTWVDRVHNEMAKTRENVYICVLINFCSGFHERRRTVRCGYCRTIYLDNEQCFLCLQKKTSSEELMKTNCCQYTVHNKCINSTYYPTSLRQSADKQHGAIVFGSVCKEH